MYACNETQKTKTEEFKANLSYAVTLSLKMRKQNKKPFFNTYTDIQSA